MHHAYVYILCTYYTCMHIVRCARSGDNPDAHHSSSFSGYTFGMFSTFEMPVADRKSRGKKVIKCLAFDLMQH